jgi:HK97 family phage portal protein
VSNNAWDTCVYNAGPGFSGPIPATSHESRYIGGGGGSVSSFSTSASLPAPVLSGVAVTPETALTFTAWFACIDVRSTDLAALPLQVKKSRPQGGKITVRSDPRYNLVFCEPNKRTTSMRFRQALHGHRHGWGNGYAEIIRLNGMPVELQLQSPRDSDTWPEVAKNGNLWYQLDGGRRQVRAEDMIHIAGLGWNGLKGYSCVALHRQAIGYGLAVEQFGAAFYGNAATPRGALKIPKTCTPEMLKNLRESFAGVHQDTTNAHRLAILEEGAEYQPFSVDPKDAEYIATRSFQVVEMCRILRVPPPRIMDFSGVSSVYGAYESFIQDYLSSTIIPDGECVEQEFNRKLFTRKERADGLHVAHDYTALTRGNPTARVALYEKRFALGTITPDEIREREGDNPADTPASKQFYISSQYVPLNPRTEIVDEPDPTPNDLPQLDDEPTDESGQENVL